MIAGIVAWSSLARRPARTFFSVLGVALGIAVVIAVHTVDHNTLLAARPDRSPEWRADLEVTPRAGVEDVEGALAGVPGVMESTPVVQVDARLARVGDDGRILAGDVAIKLVGLAAASAPRVGVFRLESGEPLRPIAEGADALIGRRLHEAGIEVGDELVVARPPRAPRRVCVDGELREVRDPSVPPVPYRVRVRGVLAYENVGRAAGGDVVVVDHPVALTVYEGESLPQQYWVARDPSVDVERLQAGLAGSFAYDLREGAVVGQLADERAFRNGVLLAGLMALALGLFVIFHTLSMSLVERVREVGVLHALGASRGQIGASFLAEAAIVAALAGGAGVAVGLGLAKAMLESGISTLGITESVSGRFDVPWRAVLPLALLGMAIALAGSVFPLLRARDTDTVSALRGEDARSRGGLARGFHVFAALLLVAVLPVAFLFVVPLVGEAGRELIGVLLMGVGVLALLIGTPLVVPGLMAGVARRISRPFARLAPFSGLLAARSIEQGPTRIAASVAAVALVTAAFVGLRGMTASLYLEAEGWADEAVVDKVFVQGLPIVAWRPLADDLRAYPGIVGVESAVNRVQGAFRVLGLAPAEIARYGPLAEDPELLAKFRGGRSLIASGRLAKQRDVAVGDSVPLSTPSGSVELFEVVAISDAYGYFADPHERVYGVVADRWLDRFFCQDTDHSTAFAVRLAPGADPGVVEPALRASLPEVGDLQLRGGRSIRDFELFDIRRDFLVFDVILGLTLLLAGVGVLNGQLLSAMERAKELGVLRALGASGRQIRDSVLLESGVIGLAGGALGLALGAALVPVIVAALRVLSGLDLPQPGFRPAYLLGPLGALAVTFLAGLYPIWRMNRMDPVRAVRTG